MAVLDIFFLILCLRVIYSALARGIICEGFKIAGLLAGSLLAFHYFSFLKDKFTDLSFLNEEYVGFISFLIIFFSVISVFSLARKIVTFLFKRKDISLRERWVMLFVGILRAVFLSSVLLFLFHLSPLNANYVTQSLAYRIFKNIAPKVYITSCKIYNGKNDSVALVNKEVQKYHEATTPLSGDN